MAGTLESINVAAARGEGASYHDAVELIADQGIAGDRYCRNGAKAKSQITLIEREQIAKFREATALDVDAAATRRNLETSGIDLNALVGTQFQVGTAVLEGIELCEPCATLGALLETADVSKAEIVRAFTHRAGLRARIVRGGIVRRGDSVEPCS
jgi:MOSC domain-containing protein YiiM